MRQAEMFAPVKAESPGGGPRWLPQHPARYRRKAGVWA